MSSMSCPSPLPLCIFGYTVQCQVKKDPKSLVLPTHSLPYSFFLVSLPLSLVMINSGRCVVHWHTHTLHIHACAKKNKNFSLLISWPELAQLLAQYTTFPCKIGCVVVAVCVLDEENGDVYLCVINYHRAEEKVPLTLQPPLMKMNIRLVTCETNAYTHTHTNATQTLLYVQ